MFEDHRTSIVKQALFDYVQSPSLKHIRDPKSVTRLAQEIVRHIDYGNSIWQKWDGQRELLLKGAIGCWVPTEALREFLNEMPGPKLTLTDVAERMKALEDDDHWNYPDEDLRAGCLHLYQREKTDGTELPAIIRAISDHVQQEHERLRQEREEKYRVQREEERETREQRLLSGADCTWTQLSGSANWYCRANGRTFRLSANKDKTWNLQRVSTVADNEKGTWVGKYRARGDATKAIKEVAYKPELW